MRKIYWDLGIAAVCLFLLLKYTIAFYIIFITVLVVWFFVLSDEKKEKIKKKIASFYDR